MDSARFFSPQLCHFWLRNQFLVPRPHIVAKEGPRTFFGPLKGRPKIMISYDLVEGSDPLKDFQFFPRGEWFLRYLGTFWM